MKKTIKMIMTPLLFLGIAIAIPSLIGIFTKIIDKDMIIEDYRTFLFLLITGILYLIAILFMLPIIYISKEIKEILKKVKNFKNLNELKSLINEQKSKYIKKPFDNFVNSLRCIDVEKDSGEIEKQYFSTMEPEIFFDEQNVIETNIFSKTISQIINSLTGIGIFGTFLGIVQGVSGLKTDNIEVLQQSIKKLLDGVKVSFNSSLYGIMFSLVALILYKFITDFAMKKVVLLCNEISRIVKPYKEESGFSILENELKKQTGINEKLASDIAEEMGKKFNESIESNLQKLSNDMGNLLEKIQYDFTNKINESNNNNIHTLTNTLTPIIEKLEVSLSNIQKYQQDSTNKFLEESILSIKDTINIGTTNEVNRLKDSMNLMRNENEKIVEKFTFAIENMTALTSQQERLMQNSTNSAEAISSTTVNIKAVQEDLLNIINSLKDYSAFNNISLENIQSTVGSLKEAIMQQSDINFKLDSMIKKTFEFNELQDRYLLKFQNIESSMENNLNSIQVNMNSVNEKVKLYQEHFDKLQASSMNIVNMLDGRYKEISSDFEDINNKLISTINTINGNLLGKLNEMSSNLNGVTKELTKFQEKTYNLTNKIEKFSDVEKNTQALWESYQNSFEELNKDIKQGVEDYTKLVASSVESLFKQYDSSIGEAITKIGSMVQSLNDVAEDICDNIESIERLKDEIKNLNDGR